MSLGIVDTDECVFNCGDKKIYAHLFFACPYSSYIWSSVLNLCSIYRHPLPWLEEIQRMVEHSKGKQLPHRLRKVAFGTAIYHIWLERNRRCFQNSYPPPQEIIRKIQGDVWAKLAGFVERRNRSERDHSLCINWGINTD
ncbi:hypothetical protein CFOL_v3_11789 [Cephalotus follicularis]|uniref:Zf-RVT domain-containing protein n=1 Tax=Cephalotus follicularis TaxID=3775 RepID=A0A1Q3BJS0_CEPFO|nr:hypothetical protein CFOL_v3_11789 [Cephalotus follicularis]